MAEQAFKGILLCACLMLISLVELHSLIFFQTQHIHRDTLYPSQIAQHL